MEAFFFNRDLVRYVAGEFLSERPQSVVALASSCSVLWSLKRLPVNMALLPQRSLEVMNASPIDLVSF